MLGRLLLLTWLVLAVRTVTDYPMGFASFLTRLVRPFHRSEQLAWASDEQETALVTDDWNAVHLIVRGNTLTHMINGRVMSVVIDDDAANRPADGLIGVQVHVGPPMKVEYRNIRLIGRAHGRQSPVRMRSTSWPTVGTKPFE